MGITSVWWTCNSLPLWVKLPDSHTIIIHRILLSPYGYGLIENEAIIILFMYGDGHTFKKLNLKHADSRWLIE